MQHICKPDVVAVEDPATEQRKKGWRRASPFELYRLEGEVDAEFTPGGSWNESGGRSNEPGRVAEGWGRTPAATELLMSPPKLFP